MNEDQNTQYHQPIAPHSGFHPSGLLLVIIAILAFILAIVGAVEVPQQAAMAGVLIFQILLVVAVLFAGIGVPVTIGYHLWHRSKLDAIKRKHATIDLTAKEAQLQRASEEHQMRLYLAQSRLMPDAMGNRPFIFNPQTYAVIDVQSGNYVQPVPATYSPHHEYNYSDTSTHGGQEEQGLLPAGVQAPTMDYIISQLPYNGLQVCLGSILSTGDLFINDLIEGTHYRIMGGSGFGKSCEAGAILDQVTQTNDPDHLLIACLDLEHKTSRLFENLPHIAQLQVGRKTIDCVATTPDEVATHFGYLRQELDRRKVMSEYDLRRERFMLIYVEEFLSLRREVDPKLLDQMLADFTILALRGRKYGLYLLACAQVDYASKDLRDAMAQFNVNMSFTVKPTAARAAGFSSNELLKANFETKRRGQFVLETTNCSDILLAPQYDVKAKLLQLESRSSTRSLPFTPVLLDSQNDRRTPSERTRTGLELVVNDTVNGNERASQAHVGEVKRLKAMNWGKQAIIERVWNVKKGGSPRYKEAEAEYENILSEIEREA